MALEPSGIAQCTIENTIAGHLEDGVYGLVFDLCQLIGRRVVREDAVRIANRFQA